MSVDECMVPFHGRLAFKQYIREKPIKWGIKVFILAESKTGYNYNFEVCTVKFTCNFVINITCINKKDNQSTYILSNLSKYVI